jgi:hypothetical protein
VQLLKQLGIDSVFVFSGQVSLQVATAAPQTLRRLLAVGPDKAKVLAVVALCNTSVSSVELYLDDNMVKAIQLEYLLSSFFLLR